MPDRNYTFLVTMTPEQYDQVLPAMQQAKVRLDAAKLAEPEINTNAVHQGCNLYSLLEEVNTSGHPPQPNRDAIQDGDEAPQPLIQTGHRKLGPGDREPVPPVLRRGIDLVDRVDGIGHLVPGRRRVPQHQGGISTDTLAEGLGRNMPERENELLANRQNKLTRLREKGIDPYPPRFQRSSDNAAAIAAFEATETEQPSEPRPEETPADPPRHSLAGRITALRIMGKSHLPGPPGRLRHASSHAARQPAGQGLRTSSKTWTWGDFLGVTGPMLRTRTGQVSINAETVAVLAKNTRPPAGEVARAAGRGNPLPPALPGPDRRPRR